MNKILMSVQETGAVHYKYIKQLKDIYKQDGINVFSKNFLTYLLCAFKKDIKTRNPYLERLYDFYISFICASDSKEVESTFLMKIFDTIIQCLEVKNVNMRYSACTFIYKYILHLLKNDETINKTLLSEIKWPLIELLEDSHPPIRIKTANILKHLQNDNDPEISSALLQNLCDNNAKVRTAITDALCKSEDNLPYIINRCRDVDEAVRITAFKRLSDMSAQILTIKQRQFILKSGMRDRSSRVKKCLETLLLPSWLKNYEYDYLKFLKAVQLDSDEDEIEDTNIVSDLILNSLFKSRSMQEFLDVLYLEEKLIPLDKLTWESALYWKTLINYLKENKLDEHWELILPEPVHFCEYLEKFCATTTLLEGSIWELQLYLLILHQLILIAVGCDIADEASRKKLQNVLVNILKEKVLSQEIILDIVKYFEVLMPNAEKRIIFFCELIADIRTPLEAEFSQLKLEENHRKKTLLKQKLHSLKEEIAQSILNQDFNKTAKLNEEMKQTKENFENFNTELKDEEVNHVKNNDPKIVINYLDIIFAMLQSLQINSIYPALKSLKDELLQEIMVVEDPIIRAKYFKCYGIICSLDKAATEENIQFFCLPLTLYMQEKCDTEVLTVAIGCLGDMFLLYGSRILPLSDSEEDSNRSLDFEILYGKSETTLNEIIDILSQIMDDDNLEVREITCEVLAKLLCHKVINSPELFSRLFIKWLNPTTADDIRLRQKLGIFVETFCQLPDVELQLEESVIPTLRTISLAPSSSPLANLSKDEVLKSIIKIINLRHDENYPIHENLAMAISMEIMKDYFSKSNVLFVKALLYLEIYRDDKTYIENLLNLCEDINIELRDKVSIKNMQKFIYSLKHE